MQKKQKLVHFLLFFYLFSSYLSAIHIHHDMQLSHDDCKVCLVVKNLHSADVPECAIVATLENNITEQTLCLNNIVLSTIYKGFNAQAPPLFS